MAFQTVRNQSLLKDILERNVVYTVPIKSSTSSRPKTIRHAQTPFSSSKRTHPDVSVCVYCGSGHGKKSAYTLAAQTLGRTLAEAGIRLVYGGGGLGLMGEVARATLAAHGSVTGIMPRFLIRREHMLKDLKGLIITNNMHERKQKMFELSSAFVALPGGIGTLEEFVEQLTWAQLGQHHKPIILANISDFWTPLLTLLDHMTKDTFIRRGLEVPFKVVNKADQIVPTLLSELQKAPQDKHLSPVLTKL